MTPDNKHDLTSIVALLVIGTVSCLSVWLGEDPGLTVAAAGVGAIGGWLTRSRQTANIGHAENVQTEGASPAATPAPEVAPEAPAPAADDGSAKATV